MSNSLTHLLFADFLCNDVSYHEFIRAAPPIPGRLLRTYARFGHPVHLICEVIQWDEKKALVETLDGFDVTVKLVPGTEIKNRFVMFLGKVESGTVLRMKGMQELGNELDVEEARAMNEHILKPATWDLPSPPSSR